MDLPVEARRPALYQRHVRRKAHLVDMPPRFQIIQGVEDEVELVEPRHSELCLLDVRMVGGDVGIGVEGLGDFLRDLGALSECAHGNMPQVPGPYQSFRLLYVFVPEEELSVQVREIDGVEVDDVDVTEAAEDEVLE